MRAVFLYLGRVGFAGLWLATGCTTILPLSTSTGSPVGPVYGRAYFLKKTPIGTRVLVCDVQQASGDVLCYEADAPPQ